MKLFLAPMEGVVDWVMRDTLTRLGGIDQCVTEFLRVTDRLHPESVFYKNCPELKTGSRTRWGTPVFVQLLGGQAEPLALNAQRAVKLGALGVDLNFGCPAKTVNRHDGGASLLKSCDRVFNIVDTVRKAVPADVPVTAKIRLGFDDPTKCLEIAQAVEEANATWLTVHCRTKTDGYKPPAYWDWIPKIKEKTKIKLIANGEIWNVADFNRCVEVTQCEDYMIGRGVMSNPFIFSQIKQSLNQQPVEDMSWERARPLLPQFFESSTLYINDYFAVSRSKQWLKALSLKNQEAKAIFDEIKVLKKPTEFKAKLHALCGVDHLSEG
ncbi:tRNA-dihydrouridine synthase family protein [Bdellovibrio bacteriovorus]|uniref:tRNA-dihydrouridine synthase n=1 Tax=Bdellovibrio bacteriovorus (strain ATCC 15356 / DSM 50701 / NCIMB 9529 / HD100) TaxID=264462 RepID=Q6MNE4_BDEBA|nr:tRNA-dihydrouridine synthase family protein [Bdellovibrio bacteriovorus]AHZ86520.1 dihydrouridine synthase [Bdellovibrio bacteriovorus]BEV67763.1 tRNA-dihydrouridine(16) synthase [Bdellovibrio bacteriovorus]CAE79208.1 Dihydrouridine synthase family protein [Bdellovibrio bacteriovorus HD100]